MILNPNEVTTALSINTIDNEIRFNCDLKVGEKVRIKYSNDMVIELYVDENGNKKILFPKFVSYRESEDTNFEDTNYSKSLDLTYIKKEI